MAKILAFDYGLKRTGLAITDELQIIASGLKTVESKHIFTEIHNLIKVEPIESFVVGEPKQMNGLPSESTELIESFVSKLSSFYPQIPVHRVDERFTSKLAFDAMLESGIGKKKRQNKALVDEISATLILQNYLDSRR